MTREQHVLALADEVGIPIHLCPDGPDEAWYVPADAEEAFLGGHWFTGPCAVVFRWNPRRQYDYLSALHELGHHVTGSKLRYPWPGDDAVLGDEIDAWRWAFEQSRERPNATTLRLVFHSRKTGLASYLGTNGLARDASPEMRNMVLGLKQALGAGL